MSEKLTDSERYDELKHDVKTLLHCLRNADAALAGLVAIKLTELHEIDKGVREAVDELKWVISES